MRDEQPVWRDPESDTWHVYRYNDVAAILADYHSFSSDFASAYPSRADLTEGNIVAMDPPRHDQLRSLVSQAFTPRAIGRLRPRIGQLTSALLDAVEDRTQIELVQDLSYPLPVTVIAELLGLPAEDRTQFKAWADALLEESSLDRGDEAAIAAARVQIGKFHDYLHGHVAQRRVAPGEDLLSDLVAAEVDGKRLDNGEIVGFATILLLAGHITTTMLLGNMLRCLDEYPDVQSTLRACPSGIPLAIEEALRYRSPVPRTARITTAEVCVGGQPIPARQMLHVWLLSANHDERRFADPDRFVAERSPNPHLAFGKGIHFCIGAPLARLEASIALDVLLQRFSQIRVDQDHALEPYRLFNGTRSLHLLVERP